MPEMEIPGAGSPAGGWSPSEPPLSEQEPEETNPEAGGTATEPEKPASDATQAKPEAELEPEAEPAYVADLRRQNEALQTRLDEIDRRNETERLAREESSRQTTVTPEQWGQVEAHYGFKRNKDENGEFVTVDPQRFIQTIEGRLANVVDQIEKKYQEHFNQRISGIEFDKALGRLQSESGFKDARQFESKMREYLEKVVRDPTRWGDVETLKHAYWWSAGQNKGSVADAARRQAEERRRLQARRPGSPSAAGERGREITPEEDELRRKAGMSMDDWLEHSQNRGQVMQLG